SDDLAGARLSIDLGAIVANWRALDSLSRPGRASAVVKANAYGLGADRVVPALAKAGCKTFFVALPAEGIVVRKHAPDADIYVLNGVHANSVVTMRDLGLRPILASAEQIALWQQTGDQPCAIQVDTGMNRLGLSVEEMLAFGSVLPVNCTHLMSHFACADDPSHPLNQQQIESFQQVAAVFSDIESSLSNSAGTLSGGAFGHDVTRPGIALYGGRALANGTNPMKPVVTLEARIAQVRHAEAGSTVSYGAAHKLKRDSKLAVVSVGYADGYPRSASGSGVPLRQAVERGSQAWIGGQSVPLVGRVTMDLMCFDVTDVPDDALAPGWIELIGRNVSIDDVADAAGTIGYEILTSLGQRHARSYHHA
ncbi:MAG: alanine racemase, partial [Pseudomonadota bacterium]